MGYGRVKCNWTDMMIPGSNIEFVQVLDTRLGLGPYHVIHEMCRLTRVLEEILIASPLCRSISGWDPWIRSKTATLIPRACLDRQIFPPRLC